jgi:hypothetical protein
MRAAPIVCLHSEQCMDLIMNVLADGGPHLRSARSKLFHVLQRRTSVCSDITEQHADQLGHHLHSIQNSLDFFLTRMDIPP